MSSVTITLNGGSSSTPSPTWRYWKDGSTYIREGIRSGAMVRDKYLAGGDLTLFLSGAGVQDTDYELIASES